MLDFLQEFIVDYQDQLWFVLRIVIAGACGVFIGWERTHRQKDAGVRTHCIIAFAAALLMVLSKYAFADILVMEGAREADPSRVASTIVSAVGFIGAGVIFRNGSSVKGLTTAAGMLATAAIGMTIGAGMYVIGVGATLILIFVNTAFHTRLKRWESVQFCDVTAVFPKDAGNVQAFCDDLAKHKIQTHNVSVHQNSDGTVNLKLTAVMAKHADTSSILQLAKEHPEIRDFNMQQ